MHGFLTFLIFFRPLVIVLAIVSAYAYQELPGVWRRRSWHRALPALLAWIILLVSLLSAPMMGFDPRGVAAHLPARSRTWWRARSSARC